MISEYLMNSFLEATWAREFVERKKFLMSNFIYFIVLRVLDFLFVNLLCFCKILICVFYLKFQINAIPFFTLSFIVSLIPTALFIIIPIVLTLWNKFGKFCNFINLFKEPES